jgi:hypothetical protein
MKCCPTQIKQGAVTQHLNVFNFSLFTETRPNLKSTQMSAAAPSAAPSAPSAASISGAPSPQVAQPEVDENYRRYYHGTVQLERIYLLILIFFIFRTCQIRSSAERLFRLLDLTFQEFERIQRCS